MLNLCDRHVLCPPGTGSESDGVNYSSEDIEVPRYLSKYYPFQERGYYTACVGRCFSIVSQQDADLCAQRLGKICLNDNNKDGKGGTSKPTYGNTIQVCNNVGTGRTVVIPADTFIADSVAEANAQALSEANKQQKNPNNPPGPTVIPPPGDNPTPVINVIPVPTLQPPKPQPPSPASTCKPCDDTVAVDSFSLVFDLPSDTSVSVQFSPALKCGTWQFCISTQSGGSGDPNYAADIILTALATDPAQTLQWSQTVFSIPCGNDAGCLILDQPKFGVNACCSQLCTDPLGNFLAICEEVSSTVGYLTRIMVEYRSIYELLPPRKFTVTGTLLAPPP